jgi:hypothetical protein
MKQETLEEAILERKFKSNYIFSPDSFLEGVKWQQERMYSEDEVLDILRKSHSIEQTSKMDSWITKWFYQFKKKL